VTSSGTIAPAPVRDHLEALGAGAELVHDDALGLEASERPAAERDVEALALHVERLGAVDPEADESCIDCRLRLLDARGSLGREPGQPTFSAARVENPGAVERDDRLDPLRLDCVQVGNVHG